LGFGIAGDVVAGVVVGSVVVVGIGLWTWGEVSESLPA